MQGERFQHVQPALLIRDNRKAVGGQGAGALKEILINSGELFENGAKIRGLRKRKARIVVLLADNANIREKRLIVLSLRVWSDEYAAGRHVAKLGGEPEQAFDEKFGFRLGERVEGKRAEQIEQLVHARHFGGRRKDIQCAEGDNGII